MQYSQFFYSLIRRHICLLAFLSSALSFSLSHAQPDFLRAEKIAPGVFVLPGEGRAPNSDNQGRVGNLGFLIGTTGVIVIDTGSSSARAHELIHAIHTVTSKPIRYVLISHPAQEVLFGDAVFADAGIPIWAQTDTPRLMAQRCNHCLETLKQVLGEARMANTRLVLPLAHVFPSGPFTLAGRKISVSEGPKGTVPGNLVIRDEATGVVFSGALLSVHRVPAVQDTTPPAWKQALTLFMNSQSFAIVPAYGPIALSNRAMRLKKIQDRKSYIPIHNAILGLQAYLDALEEQARDLYERRVPLEDVTQQPGQFPYSDWDDYSPNHAHNLFYRYLQLESDDLLSK
jgi:glyoxylase-like metal-dependent hydrolase (beta-lactamase superfamily II)